MLTSFEADTLPANIIDESITFKRFALLINYIAVNL